MGYSHFIQRDGDVAYLVTRYGVSRGRRLKRVAQKEPCFYCITDSGSPDACCCVGYCGIVVCAHDDSESLD